MTRFLRLFLAALGACVPPSSKPGDPPATGDSGTSTDSHGTSTTDSVEDSPTSPTDTAGDSDRDFPTDDDDGDGYSEFGGDCNDEVASINPGEEEDCETRADDNCQGSTWECMGGAWHERGQSYSWTDPAGEIRAEYFFRMVGLRQGTLCETGGVGTARTDPPAPSCPDCLWTFAWSDAPLEEFYSTADCSWLIAGWPSETFSLVTTPKGFTNVSPLNGSISEVGWLMEDPGVEDGVWVVEAGPGYFYGPSRTYAFEWDENGGSVAFADSQYGYYFYYYYLYGPPTRDYNP